MSENIKSNLYSHIGIIYPGGNIAPEKLDSALKIFKNSPVFFKPDDPSCFSYLAGTDKARLQTIISALHNESISVLLAARGGYGSGRLDFKTLKQELLKHPKPIMGFSDITVLLALWNSTGIKSLHGAVLSQIPLLDEQDKQLTFQLLKSGLAEIKTDLKIIDNTPANEIHGIMTGGNLATLETLTGTAIIPSFKNKIVLLEDVGEPAYKIDRMLNHLFATTDLNKAAALILGDFTDCSNFSFDIIKQLKIKYSASFSCFYGFPAGHGNRNIPVMFGEFATISEKNGRFLFKQRINSNDIVMNNQP